METEYFCYECNVRVRVILLNNAPTCEHCRGSFIEEIDNTPSGSNGTQSVVFEEVALHRRINDIVRQFEERHRERVLQRQQERQQTLLAEAPAAHRSQSQPVLSAFSRLRETLFPSSRPRRVDDPSPPLPRILVSDPALYGRPNEGVIPNPQRGTPVVAVGVTRSSPSHVAQNPGPRLLSFLGTYVIDIGELFDEDLIQREMIPLVLDILNNAHSEGTAHISPDDLTRLPMTEVSKKQTDDETQCATCMDTFILKERVAKLDCSHIFHRDCIEPWLRQHDTCPICRRVMDPKNWPKAEIYIDSLD